MIATNLNWQQANQQYLMAALESISQVLLAKAETSSSSPVPSSFSPPPALEQLCRIFGLTEFQKNVILLCAGMEMDASWPSLCATAHKDDQKPYPTFSLALSAFKSPEWNALIPTGSLRRYKLIEIGAGSALTLSPLRIDERILHYITGLQYLDERLTGLIEPWGKGGYLVTSHQQIAQEIGATWAQTLRSNNLPIIQLCGEEIDSKRTIAQAACELVGLKLNAISAQAIPVNFSERYQLIQLWKRETMLFHSALLVDCDEVDNTEQNRESAIANFIENITTPLIVTSRERRRSHLRALINFDVHHPTTDEQRSLWNSALEKSHIELNGQVETLVSHFNLSAPAIDSICVQALGKFNAEDQDSDDSINYILWDSCRSQSRPKLTDLAQHIESSSTWEDLVLPEAQKLVLRDIAAHVKQRAKVYETWGFAGKSGRGLGISALFAGASGTGKTMAADVLAKELRLDLYRIDLSSVVSKYIGETEKNLRRVFDAAEAGGAILLFDEADALFGKRSEVKDSHDRYANMEVSYLLQRMEAYRGLAILTTNLKDALDTAFLRRIRFVVKFPFPDAIQRAEIWRRIFPKDTPTEELDPNKLAKLNVAGGNIRNIALNAAFLAADSGESVKMKHILQAAQSEYVKLERPLTDAEIKGWV